LRSPSKDNDARQAASALAPVLDFLRRHAPFDRMRDAHLERLARHLKLGFYAVGEEITGPDAGRAEIFYIIKQGRVRGESARANTAEESAFELVAGECFPIGALMAHRPTSTVYRAAEDTFCYQLDRAPFNELRTASAEFQDFCARRLANLLELAVSRVQERTAGEISGAAALNAPLATLLRRAPVACRPHTPLKDALATMKAEHVGSIVVTDRALSTLGVFTLHDLLSRVVTADVSLNTPIERVMSPQPLALPPQAYAYEAALLMARAGVGHVCVVDAGKLVGVVSERDLFALQRIGLVQLSRAITHAPDIATLARLARDIHRLVDQMLVQGASVAQLTQMIALLNDHITRRVIALMRAEHGDPGVSFTWLAFGSEGRHEQMLRTDQDNGMLFVPPAGMRAEQARERLLPLARKINDALAQVGFTLCPGNIMASNPECCLSLDEWRERFSQWIEQGAPEHLLKVSIFFDLRVLDGDESPVESLRAEIMERAAATPRFLRQLAENALRNQPPLGLVRDFVTESEGEHAHMLDLKLRGATPFVDGARLLALAHELPETGTLARLRAAARAGVVDEAEAESWCDAYAFIQLRRMRLHQRQEREGRALDNHVDPDTLSDIDRRILKEAFRQARKLQARLALDYQL
jgi:CBS domain-containing protein